MGYPVLFHRKDLVALKCKSNELSYEIKTLREDRTAAEKKYVACRDPPQAENLASEISLYFHRKDLVAIKCESDELSYEIKALRAQMRS